MNKPCPTSLLAGVMIFLASSSLLGEEPEVSKIFVRGNRRVETDAILSAVKSQVGQPLSRRQVRDDIQSIFNLGYFEDVKVDFRATPEGGFLTYIVKEKPAVRKVVYRGNDELDEDDLKEVVNIEPRSILNEDLIKRNVQKIKDLYAEKGFYLADVRYELIPQPRNEVDVAFVIDEKKQVLVKEISFIGNEAIEADTIKGFLATQEGGFFSWLTSSGTYKEEAFQRDLTIISSLYYDRGYINVKVGTPLIALGQDKRFMYITVPIEEGEQYRVGDIDIEGDLIFPKEQLIKEIHLVKGDIFNRSQLGKDLMGITDMYRDEGYAYVNISPRTMINADERIIGINFQVEKGEKVYIERINIEGNDKTRDKVIRRELRIYEGELYSATGLKVSQQRVQALGFFEKVDMTTSRGSTDKKIVVTMRVKERSTGSFQVGAGFSSVENFIATAQVSNQNLFGRGQSLSFQAQLSSIRQLFNLQFVEPYFLETPLILSADLFNMLYDFDDFTRGSTGFDLTLGYPITDDIRTYLSYKLENVDVTIGGRQDREVVPIANLFRDGITSSLKLTLAWDTRDNRLFPSKGFYQSASIEYAGEYLGSENVFYRVRAFSRWYFPLFWGIVFKINGNFGFVGSTDDEGVPIFERFFLGGINSVRGFEPRSLGPRVKVGSSRAPDAALTNFNIGGNKELYFNFELEFPILEKVGIKGVVFFDAGNAFNDDEWLNPVDLRTSMGFGFRWFSPIGPLRFEWGIPLVPKEGEEPIVFEFTIGNFF